PVPLRFAACSGHLPRGAPPPPPPPPPPGAGGGGGGGPAPGRAPPAPAPPPPPPPPRAPRRRPPPRPRARAPPPRPPPQPHAPAPVNTPFPHHPPRGRVGDARAGLQRLELEILERVVDQRAHRLGGVAAAPIGNAEPDAELRRGAGGVRPPAQLEPARADQRP